MYGHIHSTESFGTVDGPGVRFVIFLGGCPLRCLYCHNPDTWSGSGTSLMSVSELLSEYEKNRSFYKKGGITVTGGEPLCQIDFVTELFAEAKKRGIHTCLDTSGATFDKTDGELLSKFKTLAPLIDLCMLDIKHIDSEKHKELCGKGNENILDFAMFLDGMGVDILIRHVVVPTYTDGESELFALGEFIGTLPHVRALDVLPYHTMGEVKYKNLGIPYPLCGLPACTKEEAERAKEIILRGVRNARSFHYPAKRDFITK